MSDHRISTTATSFTEGRATAPPSTETPRHTAGGNSEVSHEEYVRLIDAIDYTLTAHGKIDADTPLHDRIRKVYRAPIPENFRSSHAALTAKVAELEAEVARLTPAPLAWDSNSNRYYEPVELLAQKLYERFDYDGPPGTKKPAWSPHGNGLKMDEARHLARKQLREAGHRARAGEPSHDRR